MKLTNVQKFPEPIVRIVSAPERLPEANRISVTTLIRPAQQVALERRYWDEIEEDVADRIWATYGSLVHLAIERIGADNALQEEMLEASFGDWTLHGTPDLYEADGTLTDFKFVSVWSVTRGLSAEWLAQINCYAYLLREHGFPVRKAQVVCMYRDWSKSRAHEDGYPSRQAAVVPVTLWRHEEVRDYINERLQHHREPQACTADERWERPTIYAVKKKGAKRATRLLGSRGEAERWAEQNVPNGNQWDRWFEIEERLGESVRCANYCRVSQWCPQFMAHEGGTTVLQFDRPKR